MVKLSHFFADDVFDTSTRFNYDDINLALELSRMCATQLNEGS